MPRSGRPVRGWRAQFARIFVYASLTIAGLVVLIPFLFALSGSMKTPEDVFTYPPRILPHVPATATVERRGAAGLHRAARPGAGRRTSRGWRTARACASSARSTIPSFVLVSPKDALEPTGTTVMVDGEEKDVYVVTIDGQQVEVYDNRSRIGGTYVDPANPNAPPVFAVPADVVAGGADRLPDGQLHARS